jgi:hypothetical protein
VLSILFLFLVRREIEHGPDPEPGPLGQTPSAVAVTPVEVR